MSFVANTAFEARITNNDRDNLANISGLFQSGGANADCSAGILCIRGEQVPCEGYADVKNENTWYMNASTAAVTKQDVIYACNTYDNQLLTAPNGNQYFVVTETLGLGAPAGRITNFTRIDFDGQSHYRFGVGNFNADVGSNGYAVFGADGLLTPQSAKPASGLFFKVVGSGTFTAGAWAGSDYLDVIAQIPA